MLMEISNESFAFTSLNTEHGKTPFGKRCFKSLWYFGTKHITLSTYGSNHASFLYKHQ
jgi:hypothetical protein